ncbi:MAG: helix-turn-helix domain-containing protein [Candidatus Thermoplasmatota archaeon]
MAVSSSTLASADLDLGPIVLEVVDAHGYDCVTGVFRVCVVSYTDGASPADSTLDTYERLDYIGVGTHPTWTPLLPDESLRIHGRDLYLDDPLLPWLTANSGALPPAPIVADLVGVRMSESNTSVYFPEPDPDNPGAVRETQRSGVYSSDQGISYDRIGPVNAPGGNDSDNYTSQTAGAPCRFQAAACSPASMITETFNATTPNVRVGVEFQDAQAATNASRLHPDEDSTPSPPPVATQSQPLGRAPAEFHAPTGIHLAVEPPIAQENVAPGVPLQRTHGVSEGGQPPARAPVDPLPPPNPPRLPLAATIVIAAAAAITFAFAATLYTRFSTRAQVLDSAARCALLEHLSLHHSLSVMEVSSQLGVTRNAAMHHIRLLEKAGLVRLVRLRRRVMVHPLSEESALQAMTLRARYPLPARLGRAVEEHGSLSRSRLHDLMPEVPVRTRNHTIRLAIELGFIAQARRATGVAFVVPDLASL